MPDDGNQCGLKRGLFVLWKGAWPVLVYLELLRLFEAQNHLVLQVADYGVGSNTNDLEPKSTSFGIGLLNGCKVKLQSDSDIEH